MKKVYYKKIGKYVPAVSRTSSSGGGSDGSESVQREHIVKTNGGYRLVSKKTGKNLGTYPSRAGAERRERQVQYFKHINEDGISMVGGAPVNNVSGGEIAALGVGKDGEPGVNPKKKKSVVPFKTFVRKKPT